MFMQDHLEKGLNARKHSAAAEKQLQQAIEERDRFLERHTRWRVYQKEIDRILDKSGNRQGRMAVLGVLMQGKLLEMQRELCKLSEILQYSRCRNKT